MHEDEGVYVDDHAEDDGVYMDVDVDLEDIDEEDIDDGRRAYAAAAAAARDAAEARSPSRQRCRRVLQIRLKIGFKLSYNGIVALIAMCN